jgi:hypothetical protein
MLRIHSRLYFEVLYWGSINGQRIGILLRGLDAIDVGTNELSKACCLMNPAIERDVEVLVPYKGAYRG